MDFAQLLLLFEAIWVFGKKMVLQYPVLSEKKAILGIIL